MNNKPFMPVEQAKNITDEQLNLLWKKFSSFIKTRGKGAQTAFNELSKPVVTWKKFGFQVAGRAFLEENRIEMNENYLYSLNYKDFVYHTFQHELAHILAFEIFGEDKHKGMWKSIDILFGDDGSAFHSYSDPVNKPIRKNQVSLKCACGCKHVVTKNMFNKFQTGSYTCTTCKHNMKEAKIVA